MLYIIVEIPESSCAGCPLYKEHDLASWCGLEFLPPSKLRTVAPKRPKQCRDAELRNPKLVQYSCNPAFACATHGRCWTHSQEDK